MRIVFAFLASILLAACSGGDDFSVDVTASPQKVQAALGNLHSSSLPAMMSLRPATKSSPGDGQILYTIPAQGKYDPATILLSISDIGGGKSRITVNADVPAVTKWIGGEQKYISETKFESYLKKELTDWARHVSKGDTGLLQVSEMQSSLAGLAVAIQYEGSLDKLAAGELPPGLDFGAFDDDGGGYDGAEYDSGYGGSDIDVADASPMLDPSADAASYGAPTDTGPSAYSEYDSGDGGWGDGAS